MVSDTFMFIFVPEDYAGNVISGSWHCNQSRSKKDYAFAFVSEMYLILCDTALQGEHPSAEQLASSSATNAASSLAAHGNNSHAARTWGWLCLGT